MIQDIKEQVYGIKHQLTNMKQRLEAYKGVSKRNKQLILDFVSYGEDEVEEDIESTAKEVTREDAIAAISQAEIDIQEMEEAGLGIVYVNDTLLEAQKALERADYAELLKTENYTNELVKEAKAALEGLDWKGFTYTEVLTYTDEIAQRKEQAYAISDSLRAVELKLEDFKKQGVETEEVDELFESAGITFKEERYTEAEKLIEETDAELEASKAEMTSLTAIRAASKTFIQRNWWKLIIAGIILSIAGWFGYKKYALIRAKSKLKHLKAEKETLTQLMKKAQRERFEEGSIPESTYTIRMDKYREKMAKAKQTIPVLRAILGGRKKVEPKFITKIKSWFK